MIADFYLNFNDYFSKFWYVWDLLFCFLITFGVGIISVKLYVPFFVFVAINGKIFKYIFQTSLFRYFGKISYSLYLIHIPVIMSFSSYFFSYWKDKTMNELVLYVGVPTIVISFILAHFFTHIDTLSVKCNKYIVSKYALLS